MFWRCGKEIALKMQNYVKTLAIRGIKVMRLESNQQILEDMQRLQAELDRIYAVNDDLRSDELAAVSHALDALLVRYLRSQTPDATDEKE